MKKGLRLLWILSFLWITLVIAWCDNINTNTSNTKTILPENSEISYVMKELAKETKTDISNIKEDSFERYNYAEHEYDAPYDENNGYYNISWYSLQIKGLKELPNRNRIFDWWHVFYVWDEISASAIEYSKDNIICSYFLALEQEIPTELLAWMYGEDEDEDALNKAWDDFYEIATYEVDLSCWNIPQNTLQLKNFNYNAEGMEPFWSASIRWDYIMLMTPNFSKDIYIDNLKADWNSINFKWYNLDWKLEKTNCIDEGAWENHDYKISFDYTYSIYWDDWIIEGEETSHYEWCADAIDLWFISWEEWTLDWFVKKSWYKYSWEYMWNFKKENINYTIDDIVNNYVQVTVYWVEWDEFENYQIIMEKNNDKWNFLYEWKWYEISDDECERLNQYDNNLMDMFFLTSCPRG